MRRREFTFLLGGAMVLTALPSQAQWSAKVPRIGILSPAETDRTLLFEAFRNTLRDLGYVEGDRRYR
jgi:hypothetical protein